MICQVFEKVLQITAPSMSLLLVRREGGGWSLPVETQ